MARCTATYFTDGGRTEKQCHEVAELTCKICDRSVCREHSESLYIDPETNICEECDNEPTN
jgi:hypothetical protein